MMHEDFERAHLIDAAIMTADLMEEIYRTEMEEDLKDPVVQRAFGVHPDQRQASIEEQDLDFEISHKAA